MKIASLVAAAVLLAQASVAGAAEVRVLSAAALRPVLNELGPQFERATGHKLVVEFGVIDALRRKIDAGEPFDVAILTGSSMGDLAQQGKIIAATRADIARSGMGVFVRAGATKPDITSADAFKRAMLGAKSITYNGGTPVAAYLPVLFERLGISEQVKPKTQVEHGPGGALDAVASGRAELGFVVVSVFETNPALELVGPLPAELQSYTVYAAGVAAASREAESARALINFLKAPAAAPVLRAKGMEAVAP